MTTETPAGHRAPPPSGSGNREPDWLPRRRSRRALCLLLLALVSLLAVLWRLPGIESSRVFYDEGARIAVAQAIAEGEAPYRDVVNFGPPGGILFNALFLRLFDASVLAVRIPYLVVSLLSLLLVFYITGRLFGWVPALFSALLFAAAPDEVFYSYHAMTEPLVMFFNLAALAVILNGRARYPFLSFAAAGAMTFYAALVKQPGVFVGLAVLAAAALDFLKSRDGALLTRRLGGLAAGALLLFAGWSAYLVAGQGWWRWFHDMTSYGGLSIAEHHRVFDLPPPTEVRKWSEFFAYASRRSFMVLGLFGLLLPLRGGLPLTAVRISACLVTLFMLLFLPLTYDCSSHSHYLLLFEPFWMILSGGTIYWLLSLAARGRRWRGVQALGRASLALLIVCLSLLGGKGQGAALTSGMQKRDSLPSLSVQRAIAADIAAADRVLVLANPIFYFYSGKRPPTEPLDYFVFYRLRSLTENGAQLDEVVLELLDQAELLLVDPTRLEILRSVLARAEGAPALEPVPHSEGRRWPRLYSVSRRTAADR